ncbi:Protein of unknown function [Microlunatus sagamiharensis]|uniref:S-adenosylmethionine tRNA ribosyltransferase n=1 Tax=Microlunatus sagamiharensis TaxID=546874 RepID=A0A1H2M718_9ACTN|nr:DUF3253 domain-containing protein [Microlunatus sagamiharensis]SDU88912.1 Protein of unknown function [Microlunatus sagamiharensis]
MAEAAGADDEELEERLRRAVLDLLGRRAPTSTICPSDAARAVGGDTWRDAMPLARVVAARLADAGVVEVRQHGERVDVRTARGPVRIARAGGFDAAS